MFARLKKKIIDEGGNVIDGEKGFIGGTTAGPGIASPINKVSAIQSNPSGKEWPDTDSGLSSTASPNSQSSEDIALKDGYSSKEEIISLLMRKTEQCKKLEIKISDIKDKKKAVEKLESAVEENQNDLSQQIQELDDQHTKTLAESVQEKVELQNRLEEVEKLRLKFYKQEEENDEFQGLATQELAKVKHLLLNAENQLSKTTEDLKQNKIHLEETEKLSKEMEIQIVYLKEQVDSLTIESNLLKEECKARAQAVETLTIDRAAFEKRINELTELVKQKSQQLSSLEASTAELENNHQTLQRTYDIYKTKMTKMIDEREEHIEQLEERVKTLEQRLNDHGLSEDDRIKALEMERTLLEKKLSESRQQLQDVKSTWSDKITHLEGQISHLNAKIIEDSQELAGSQRETEVVKENLLKQMEDLQMQLEDAEKRASEHWDLATEKDILYDKEKQAQKLLIQQMKLDHANVETRLLSKITSLECEISEELASKEAIRISTEQTIARLEEKGEELFAKQLLLQRKVKTLEDENKDLRAQLTEKEREYECLVNKLEEKTQIHTGLEAKLGNVEEQLATSLKELQSMEIYSCQKTTDLQICTEEKDKLLLRNAELSQQLQSLQQSQQLERLEHEQELKEKNDKVASLEKEITNHLQSVNQGKEQITELEAQLHDDSETSAELDKARNSVRQLEEMLNEKNKALKMQQQKLTDLRKTLQKELKVQALPNDDLHNENRETSQTPPLKRKNSLGQSMNLSTSLTKLPHEIYAKNLQIRPARSNCDLPVNVSDSFHVKADEKDVNFQYLKHVVLKFMLSRENEALQLIRAVSVLLKFNSDEQQMIRETLEYKMSWFGSRPPSLGRGQTAKIIPPSF